MCRPLLSLLVAACVVAAWAEGASAARCEPDELISELRMTLDLAPPPPDDTPRPMRPGRGGERLCVPGAADDDACRPHHPLPPGPAGASILLLPTAISAARPGTLPTPPARRLSRERAYAGALAPGHARRIDRPPRSA
jgi:hypothetical protein